jgi:hypothetical protein
MPGMMAQRPRTTPIAPFQQFGDPASFTAGAQKQAYDYDTIMKNYENVIGDAKTNPITALMPQYSQSADVTKSLSDLSGLSDTGGYTPEGIANIRERDISPTRSIYANAQQNVERTKALGGGYSPNFNATQAQMARDESNQIASVDTAANAGIAQNVAANRLAASGSYAGAAANANNERTSVDQSNANRDLEARLSNRGAITGAIGGEANLYGTTPALTNTFGNQVMQARGSDQQQQQLNQQQQRDIYGLARGY